jgi:hypothetical protein
MATTTPYFFIMHQGTGVVARALLNDLPFYRGLGQRNHTVSGPANHLLLPGENVLTIEVYPGTRPAIAPAIEGPVELEIKVDDDTAATVHKVAWPDAWAALPVADRVLPFLHTSRFVVDDRLPLPPYWDAPPARFGLEGLPGQHAAVREVHRSFVDGDVEGFFDANRLKLEERQRAYPDTGDFAAGTQREKLAGYFGRAWDVRPLGERDLDELVFESRAGGRVAYVTRADGGRAIEAIAADDPSETFAADLFLTQRDGRWRVFR